MELRGGKYTVEVELARAKIRTLFEIGPHKEYLDRGVI
jgi:hypothetical protein